MPLSVQGHGLGIVDFLELSDHSHCSSCSLVWIKIVAYVLKFFVPDFSSLNTIFSRSTG